MSRSESAIIIATQSRKIPTQLEVVCGDYTAFGAEHGPAPGHRHSLPGQLPSVAPPLLSCFYWTRTPNLSSAVSLHLKVAIA